MFKIKLEAQKTARILSMKKILQLTKKTTSKEGPKQHYNVSVTDSLQMLVHRWFSWWLVKVKHKYDAKR